MTGAWLETEEGVLESRAQLRNRLHSLLEEGELPEERREEGLSALDVDARSDSEICPADDDVALSTAVSPEENFERVRNAQHTRFPLVGEEPTDFHGLVYAPSIFDHLGELRAGHLSFTEIAAPPPTLAAEGNASDAFDQFQAVDREVALVISDGNVVGLLTATDALEAVMGELEEPLDQRTAAERRGKAVRFRRFGRHSNGRLSAGASRDDGCRSSIARVVTRSLAGRPPAQMVVRLSARSGASPGGATCDPPVGDVDAGGRTGA
jgi:CBS domain containing-hemolysin-like protein